MVKDIQQLTRVELHSHLDGSVRAETVWELSKAKGLPLPGNGSLRDTQNELIVRHPIDLMHFLQPFRIIIPALQDDLAAAERIAFEYIEDKAYDKVAYVEARFAPHGLLTDSIRDMPHLEAVVAAIWRGLERGRTTFGVDSRLILCTLIGQNTAEEVLELCQRTRDHGVVAIDTASACDGKKNQDEVPTSGLEPGVFQRAAQVGLHRTVHAGERGPAEMVRRAVEVYGAERIGHGYRVLEDLNIYGNIKEKNIHLECCPWSSFLTGAVPLGVEKHPIVTFAEDQANFSVNTDDPTITGHSLSEDYSLCGSWKLTEAQLLRASLNAADAAFLPETDRAKLRQRILNNVIPGEK